MGEFFVIIFGDGTYYQYRLKELLSNSFNGFINEDFSFIGVSFYLPIISKNNKYLIYNKNKEYSIVLNGEKINTEKNIKHGDYVLISNKRYSLSALIINQDNTSLGSNIYELKYESSIFIGRSESMNIVLDYSTSISRKHAAINIDKDGTANIHDLSEKTGIFLNKIRIKNAILNPGDEIYIMGTNIVFFNNFLVVPKTVKVNNLDLKTKLEFYSSKENLNNELYVRTPRIKKSLEIGTIEIDPPTPPQKQKEMPFVLVVGPSLTMILAMLTSFGITFYNASREKNYTYAITSGIIAFSMLIGAILWPKLSRNYMNSQSIKNEEHRQNRYLKYLEEKEKEIKYLYNRNTRIWNENLYPNIQKLVDNVSTQNRRLWERSINDDDFLGLRVGSGSKKFEVTINTTKRGFELEEDDLKEQGYKIAEKYRELNNIPITLSIKDYKVSGVVGDYENISKNIICNLVSLYSPEEVKLVLIYNIHQRKFLKQFNDLPHTWSNDMNTRYVATSEEETYNLFLNIDEYIKSRELTIKNKEIMSPHFVFLIFDKQYINNVPFKKNLIDTNNSMGLSSIFFGEKFNQIPKESSAIIQSSKNKCVLYIKNENNNKLINFEADNVYDEDINTLVKKLSKVRIKKEKNNFDIPNSVSFLDLFKVGNIHELEIESNWDNNNSNKSLATPIGVMSGNKKFYLDIHEKYHGSHGLVAGTTGSGKSEFLQGYILSMMINYSPNEVSFVLVDFKGGDMARPFLNSPHLSATISNLSGNTLYRALVSLEAEVKNRQQMFNKFAFELGVDKLDINSYHKYFKENKIKIPLPHLIIVIDEFAQLKSQHPEFMSKLIDISQVGRSLGIHLILATQKPSGVVDPQIWSNSRFKVCLKVIDKQDSTDIISKPFAAMIKNPGRAYVQVGYDEIFELIQSGYSGIEYIPQDKFTEEDSITVKMVNWTGEKIREAKDITKVEKTNSTQLEAIVKKINIIGKNKKLYSRKLWLDPLSDKLRIKDIKGSSEDYIYSNLDKNKPGKITVGMIDIPHVQKQKPFVIDFIKDGHIAIYGSSGSGKSTLIQSIFYSMSLNYSPKMFNSFLIDFNGGSLIGLSKMPHCISYTNGNDENKVSSILDNINKIIIDRRKLFTIKSCTNYESFVKSGFSDMPIILVVIDNYYALRENLYKQEEKLVQIISEANSCGIYFIITGNSKGAIFYKVLDHIKTKIIFNMNDQNSYRDIFNTRVPFIPENIKGRALILNENKVVEMQVAVPFDTDNETFRNESIINVYENMKSKFNELNICKSLNKKELEFTEYEDTDINITTYKRNKMKKLVTENTIIDIGFDIENENIIGISDTNKPFFICDKNKSDYEISNIIKFLTEKKFIVNIFSKRKKYNIETNYIENIDEFIKSYVHSIDSNSKILLIDGFSDFFDTISNETLDLLVSAINQGSIGKIITIDDMTRIIDYSSTELYLQLVKCTEGMIIGGNATNSLAFALNNNFYKIPEHYRKISLEDGQALIFSGDMAAYVQLRR